MRTTSTLVGLVLFTLTATARAEEAAPAAAATAPPAGEAAATPVSTSTSTPTPTPTPAATPSTPLADNAAAELTPVAGPPAVSRRKFQVALAFLPMGLGTYKYSDTFTSTVSSEAYFAYGFGLSGNYEVLRGRGGGLLVGFAPQAIFNVQAKPSDAAYAAAMKEYDLMVRVAYVYPIMDTISVYAEALPGFSLIVPSDDAAISEGFVLAFGAGFAMDMTDRFFINLGAGYQMGFQSQAQGIHQMELRTKYVRVALGGGVRF